MSLSLQWYVYLNEDAFDKPTIFSPYEEFFVTAFNNAENNRLHIDEMRVALRELKRQEKEEGRKCLVKSVGCIREYSNLMYRRKPPFDQTKRHQVFTIA